MALYIPVCDWFQVSVANTAALPFAEGTTIGDEVWKFDVVGGREFNPYYSRSVVIKYKGEDAFHLHLIPRHPSSRREDCGLKVANRLLYAAGWVDVLRAFLRIAGLSINHLQRVDIAADFNYFHDASRPNTGLTPARFIRDYFSRPTDKRPSYYRKGSNKFRTYGQKTPKRTYFETLSFGMRTSPVQVNLYNKTQELKTHDKPWIRSTWEAGGLDIGRDVWRVEFSLQPEGMALEHLTHHYFTDVQVEMCGYYSNLDSLFVTLAKKYFVFYYLRPGHLKQGLRTNREEPVVLFDFHCAPTYKHLSLSHAVGGGIAERNASKCLQRLAQAAEETTSTKEKQSLLNAAKILDAVSHQKHLDKGEQMMADTMVSGLLASVAPKRYQYSDRYRERLISRYLMYLQGKQPEVYDALQVAFRALDGQVSAYVASLHSLAETIPPELVEE
jgi:hypothetical protein